MPLSFFQGQVIEEHDSAYSGKIQLIKHLGGYKIVAGNLLQSGSIIKNLWQKPLKAVRKQKTEVENILLLGLGGGTIIPLLTKQWPQAEITALEIDHIMLKLAKTYFELERYPQVKAIQADAFTFVEKCSAKYDLVIVDLFCGNQVDNQLYTEAFLQDLKQQLNPTGFLLINHLFFGQYQHRSEQMVQVLEKEFQNLHLIRSLSNLFFLAKHE